MNPRQSTKRQHYVQKILLSQFTSTPDNPYAKQRIWIYDKQQQTSFQTNLVNTAVQKKFLTNSADGRITRMETECFPIIQRIIQKKCITCTHFPELEPFENLFGLYRYIGHQLYRTPAFRKKVEILKYWKEKDAEEIKHYQSELFQHPDFIFMDFDLTGKNRAVSNSHKNLAKMYYFWTQHFSSIPLNQADDLAASLFDIVMSILYVNETKIPFITSDLGVSWYFPMSTFTLDIKADGHTIHCWLAFPISPTISIFLCTTKSLSIWLNSLQEPGRGMLLNTKDEATVKLINKNTFYLADRFVYSPVEINPKYESKN